MKKLINFKKYFPGFFAPSTNSKKLTQQSVNYLYTPIIAILLFMLAMIAILWSLSTQESDQAEIAFDREVSYAEQRIQANFDLNEEEILSISKKLPTSLGSKFNGEFYKLTSNMLNKHPEILLIQNINKDSKKNISYPSADDEDWNSEPSIQSKLNSSLLFALKEAQTS